MWTKKTYNRTAYNQIHIHTYICIYGYIWTSIGGDGCGDDAHLHTYICICICAYVHILKRRRQEKKTRYNNKNSKCKVKRATDCPIVTPSVNETTTQQVPTYFRLTIIVHIAVCTRTWQTYKIGRIYLLAYLLTDTVCSNAAPKNSTDRSLKVNIIKRKQILNTTTTTNKCIAIWVAYKIIYPIWELCVCASVAKTTSYLNSKKREKEPQRNP